MATTKKEELKKDIPKPGPKKEAPKADEKEAPKKAPTEYLILSVHRSAPPAFVEVVTEKELSGARAKYAKANQRNKPNGPLFVAVEIL